VAVVQYTFTHKQYTEYRERNLHNNKKKKKIGKCGPCPVFASYTLAFALQLKNKHGKTSVRVDFIQQYTTLPVPVAARSKAWVCGRSLGGTLGSYPGEGM
jgi:hypothetical protein